MKIEREFKSEDEYIVTHTVDRNQTGLRLDAFLKERYSRRSRETLKRAIDEGAIQLQRNQGPHLSVGKLKPSTQLIFGDEVLVVSERKPEPPVSFDYKILFEDDVLFVINKPANLPVHPAGRYFFNTLLVHLRTEGHSNPVLKADREFFLAHRIDKETSGILVLTKDRAVCAHLTTQFAERTTEKRYLAVVKGATPDEFTVNAAMRRHTTSRVELKMMVTPDDSEGAQHASTRFKRLQVVGEPGPDGSGQFSLVECFPKTGRQHQIRVHLDHVGHPIVGDKLYGMTEDESLRYFERQFISPEAEAKLLLPRHALHAAGIGFEHPITGLRVEFRSGLPEDLQAFLDSRARGETGPTRVGPAVSPAITPLEVEPATPALN